MILSARLCICVVIVRVAEEVMVTGHQIVNFRDQRQETIQEAIDDFLALILNHN